MSELEALIEILGDINLRRASREIDGRLFKLIYEKPGDVWDEFGEGVWHRRDPEDTCAYDPPPAYTASLDEAMKLVPGMDMANTGVWWSIQQTGGSNGSGKSFYIARVYVVLGERSKEFVGFGEAPIALATAALRSRLALSRGPEAFD